MKYTLSAITLLVSLVLLNACQEESDQIKNQQKIEQTLSSAFQQSSPINQQVYLKVSQFLETNPVESLIEPEMNYHEWIIDQESIDPVTQQELLSISNGISSLVCYSYNQEINGWDVHLLTARDNGQSQVVKGDALTIDAINYELLGSGEKSPNYVLFKKKKRKPINVDEKGCTKRVCDGGHCHEITFVPCKLSRGLESCTVLGSSCGSAGGVNGSLIDSILTFEF